MKKVLLFHLLIGIAACTIVKGQSPSSGVYLYIPTYTANSAIAGHTNEVRLTSVSFGAGVGVGSPTNNPSPEVSTPSLSEIAITKNFDVSSLRIYNALLSRARIGIGTNVPDRLEIRYYNGTATTPVYVIRLDKAIISSYSSTNSQCTTGCSDVVESISIAPIGTITYRNQAVTPNQVLIYNLVTNTTTLTE